MAVFYVLSIQFVKTTFYSDFNLCYLGVITSSVSRLNLVALLSFVKVSNTPFDRLFISTEKLVSELLLSGIIWDLRILSYKMLLFIYSVLIRLDNDAFVTVSNSKEMLEIFYDASGFVALITSE